jgi:hypothetical protein
MIYLVILIILILFFGAAAVANTILWIAAAFALAGALAYLSISTGLPAVATLALSLGVPGVLILIAYLVEEQRSKRTIAEIKSRVDEKP